MHTKNIVIVIVVVLLIGFGVYWRRAEPVVNTQTPSGDRAMPYGQEPATQTDGKAETFSGKLEQVNTGCFADGECYVVVGGKHVTVLMGWSRTTVGSTLGVESFGDLESHIGENVEVYAQMKDDGTYTLYGNESYYVKLK